MPQGDEIWLVLVRKCQGFLEDEDGKQKRPYMLMLFCIHPESMMLDEEMLTNPLGRFPNAATVYNMIEKQIKKPREVLKNKVPQRPKSIIFTSRELYQKLGPQLTQDGMLAKYWTEQENQGFGDDTARELSAKLREKSMLGYTLMSLKPGLDADIHRENTECFFTAAAAFYRAAPWTAFQSRELFTVTRKNRGTRLFFLACTEKERSLGMETSPSELLSLYQTGERKTLDPAVKDSFHRLLVFSPEFNAPLIDLDNAEKYEWDVAGEPDKEACFPFPYCFRKEAGEEMFRPEWDELDWWQAALLGLAQFTKNWKSGLYRDADPEVSRQKARDEMKARQERLAARQAARAAKIAAGEIAEGDEDEEGEEAPVTDASAREVHMTVEVNKRQAPIVVGYWSLDLPNLHRAFSGTLQDWAGVTTAAVFSPSGKPAGSAASSAAAVAATPASAAMPAMPAIPDIPATGDLTACAVCGKREADGGLKRCGQCKRKMYCSQPCQKAHWSVHKLACGK